MAESVIAFDGVWKKFRRGEHHDSLRRDWCPPRPALDLRCANRSSTPTNFGASQRLVRGQAGSGAGDHRTERRRKIDRAESPDAHPQPTRGTARVEGRVGALIELAAGFHPDLTGRENVFLQGAIMGMRREEIRRRFDEIIDFAGIPDFVDTPVKRYSSGMNARLGFAIAAHLDPQVLLIDEVLAVGDFSFSRSVTRGSKNSDAPAFPSHRLAQHAGDRHPVRPGDAAPHRPGSDRRCRVGPVRIRVIARHDRRPSCSVVHATLTDVSSGGEVDGPVPPAAALCSTWRSRRRRFVRAGVLIQIVRSTAWSCSPACRRWTA